MCAHVFVIWRDIWFPPFKAWGELCQPLYDSAQSSTVHVVIGVSVWRQKHKVILLNLLFEPSKVTLWGKIVELNWCGGTHSVDKTPHAVCLLFETSKRREGRKVWCCGSHQAFEVYSCLPGLPLSAAGGDANVQHREACDQFFISKLAIFHLVRFKQRTGNKNSL